jgi:predicted acylesterase/phospholipase RssA
MSYQAPRSPAIPSLQVAFQGGGAKFVSLMAAAHSLQQAHRTGEISLKRVSGTSAGAIVAALLVADADFSKVSQFLAARGREYLLALTGGKNINSKLGFVRVALCSWFGKAVFDQKAFNAFLAELFRASVGTLPNSLADAVSRTGIELLITTSDLRESVARRLKSDAPLTQAIADSCAIPLFFRGHADLRINPNVDGGLCENLPVEGLLAETETLGEVFAVTPLSEEKEFDGTGLLPYLMRLFDVSIDNSVKRSKAFVDSKHLIEIKTGLKTFDFDMALSQLEGSAEYTLIRKNTDERIKEYISEFKVGRHRLPTLADFKRSWTRLRLPCGYI